MKYILTTMLLIATLLPTAALAQGQSREAPPITDLAQADVSPDIKLAIAGVIQKLRGNNAPIEGVEFIAAGQHKVGESGFNYDGYDATGIAVTGYTATMVDDGKAMVILEGIILFKDVLMRRTGAYFCVQYLASKDGISIKKSVTAGLPPDFPRVESFIISEDALRAGMGNLTTYADYYLYIIENAEPMAYGPNADSTGRKDKYFIVTFCKDRLFDESALNMKIMSRPMQRGKTIAKPVFLNDSGWRFMIAGGRFRPGARSAKFYVTVSYKQDPKSYLPEMVVGEFENVKQEQAASFTQTTAPTPAQASTPTPPPVPTSGTQQASAVPVPKPAAVPVPQPEATTASMTTPQKPAPAPFVEGPLGSGQSFLNPVFPEDVSIIQNRLKKLGYYKASIDMEFGPLTKKALDRYAVRSGFPAGQWNLDLQKTLFKDTGL